MCLRHVVIGPHERGLAFLDDQLQDVLRPGHQWIFDPCERIRVDVVSVRDVWLKHPALGAIVASGMLAAELEIVELQAHEQGVVWIDDSIEAVVGPGLHAFWRTFHDVHVDVVDTRVVRLERERSSPESSGGCRGRV